MTLTLTKNSRRAARGPALDLQALDAVDARAVCLEAAGPSEQPRGALVECPNEIELLYAALNLVIEDKHPRTAHLLASSSRKVAQKVVEEASEVALAAVKHKRANIVRESADLLYQLAILWHREGILPQHIWDEMHRRADILGIAEKLPKPTKGSRKRVPHGRPRA